MPYLHKTSESAIFSFFKDSLFIYIYLLVFVHYFGKNNFSHLTRREAKKKRQKDRTVIVELPPLHFSTFFFPILLTSIHLLSYY